MLDPSLCCLVSVLGSRETNNYHGKGVVVISCHEQDRKHDMFWFDFATLGSFASHIQRQCGNICAESFKTTFAQQLWSNWIAAARAQSSFRKSFGRDN